MKYISKAAGASAALSALFLVVYGGSNWIASLHPHVGSFYFAWERHIPFVPAMIVPYMSIDLFFIAAPFVVRSDRQLKTLAGRITLAILISGVCFLLIPLKFAFNRPQVDGLFGLIFNEFRGLDLPFNQFPSLHIALAIILIDIYFRRYTGLLRWGLAMWFSLIAVSTLLTYQHHVIDILGGIFLGSLCLHLIADQKLRAPFIPNRRVGFFYAAGAALLTTLAFAWTPWSIVLLWPAFSLMLVSAGYFFLGPGIYRKYAGRHSWMTWVLLWPVLIGQHLSLAYYVRRCRSYDPLMENLWIGRRLSNVEAREAQNVGVVAVVDLTAEFSEPSAFRDLPYLQLAMLDLTAPTPGQIDQAVAFIKQHVEIGIVYLHCKAGYSRTAAISGAYLLATGDVQSVEQAIARLRCCRPSIIVRPEARAALEAFHERIAAKTEKVP